MDKKTLRVLKRQQRKVFPLALKEVYNDLIYHKVMPLLEPYQTIGVYLSLDEEIETLKIVKTLLEQHKTVCSPCVINQQQMIFRQVVDLDQLKKGCMSILEPIETEPLTSEVLLIPLLAFNSKGYRIGYGKGYYDRYLASYTGLKIGLAYDWMFEDFQPGEHDIACDLIVTETKIVSFT